MNKHIIIGNLARDPELRTTQSGMVVCQFTVAVNRRTREGEQLADFISVSAWDKLGELCAEYLSKGRKVMVCGRPSARAWTGRDGTARAGLELTASEVEFLSPRGAEASAPPPEENHEFVEVDSEEVPF